jgi:hypothetical protein
MSSGNEARKMLFASPERVCEREREKALSYLTMPMPMDAPRSFHFVFLLAILLLFEAKVINDIFRGARLFPLLLVQLLSRARVPSIFPFFYCTTDGDASCDHYQSLSSSSSAYDKTRRQWQWLLREGKKCVERREAVK